MAHNNQIIEQLKSKIQSFQPKAEINKVGTVLEVGDGIAKIDGLTEVKSMEMLDFGNNIFGVALNLEESSVGAIILGSPEGVNQGDIVKSTGKILSVPVGPGLVGRVLDALGQPKDGKGKVESVDFYPVEKIAPGVITRQSVHQPMQTGIKAIDADRKSVV